MGSSLTNSNATQIYYIINFLGVVACIACVAMIVLAVIRIMTGDEQDHRSYLRRISNGVIALILILTITTTTTLVTKYVPTSIVSSNLGIGDFTAQAASSSNGDIAASYSLDGIKNGKLFIIDDEIYTIQGNKDTVDVCKSWTKSLKIQVYYLKLYSDCTGSTHGAFATKYFVRFESLDEGYHDESVKAEENKRKGRVIFSYTDWKEREKIDDSYDAWWDWLDAHAITATEYSEDSNPWTETTTEVLSETGSAELDYLDLSEKDQTSNALTIAKKIKKSVDGGSTYDEAIDELSETELGYWYGFLNDTMSAVSITNTLSSDEKKVYEVFGCSSYNEFMTWKSNH